MQLKLFCQDGQDLLNYYEVKTMADEVKTMADDDMVIQGTKPSAAMVFYWKFGHKKA